MPVTRISTPLLVLGFLVTTLTLPTQTVRADDDKTVEAKKFSHTANVGNNQAVQVYLTDTTYPTVAVFSKAADSDQLTIFRYKLSQRTGTPIEITKSIGKVGSKTETVEKTWNEKALTDAKSDVTGFEVLALAKEDPWNSHRPKTAIKLQGVTVKFEYGSFISSGIGTQREGGDYSYTIIETLETDAYTVVFTYDSNVHATRSTYRKATVIPK